MARRASGEGSIVKTAEGWRARVVIDGRRVERRATTKAGAKAALDELRGHADYGVEPSRMTVEQWLLHWLDHIAALSPDTERGYRAYLRNYIGPMLGHIPLAKLRSEDIERLYTAMRDGTYRAPIQLKNGQTRDPKPLSSSTIRQAHAILGRALRVALQRRHIVWNPADAVEPPKTTTAKVESLQPADARAVREAARADVYEARWLLALALGLRPAEALGLAWDMLDGSRLTISRQLTYTSAGLTLVDDVKTSTARRTLSLPAPIVDALERWRQRQLLWQLDADWQHWQSPGRDTTPLMMFTMANGSPLKPRHDATLWGRLLDAAGVPHQRRYVARHTAASTLLDMGVPLSVVAEILGHRDESFTRRTYVDIFDSRLDEAAETIASLWA